MSLTSEANWRCVCPFLDGSESFANGVEFGLLYGTMQTTNRIEDFFLNDNQDQILLLASRLNWKVNEIKPLPGHERDWFWISMEKKDDE